MSGQGWTVTKSPCLTRRLCLTTRLIRTLPSSRSSSANTIRTVSLRILPLTRTVSPRKSCKVSIVLLERAITELSSLTASVTLLVRGTYQPPFHIPRCRCSITGNKLRRSHLHQRVGLLLLLQNCCRSVQLLRLSQYPPPFSRCMASSYIFLLAARGITDIQLASIEKFSRRQIQTYLRFTLFLSWVCSGSALILTKVTEAAKAT